MNLVQGLEQRRILATSLSPFAKISLLYCKITPFTHPNTVDYSLNQRANTLKKNFPGGPEKLGPWCTIIFLPVTQICFPCEAHYSLGVLSPVKGKLVRGTKAKSLTTEVRRKSSRREATDNRRSFRPPHQLFWNQIWARHIMLSCVSVSKVVGLCGVWSLAFIGNIGIACGMTAGLLTPALLFLGALQRPYWLGKSSEKKKSLKSEV